MVEFAFLQKNAKALKNGGKTAWRGRCLLEALDDLGCRRIPYRADKSKIKKLISSTCEFEGQLGIIQGGEDLRDYSLFVHANT